MVLGLVWDAVCWRHRPARPRARLQPCVTGRGLELFAFLCRTANRFSYIPTYSDDDIGFRSVLPSGQ